MTKINAYFKLMRFDKPIGVFLLLWRVPPEIYFPLWSIFIELSSIFWLFCHHLTTDNGTKLSADQRPYKTLQRADALLSAHLCAKSCRSQQSLGKCVPGSRARQTSALLQKLQKLNKPQYLLSTQSNLSSTSWSGHWPARPFPDVCLFARRAPHCPPPAAAQLSRNPRRSQLTMGKRGWRGATTGSSLTSHSPHHHTQTRPPAP